MVISAALLSAALFPIGAAHAQIAEPNAAPQRISGTGSIDGYVSEASQRFDIPALWIRAVMQAESGGNANAVSPKGALGLMQLMPATYADMRLRYGLGDDPMQPHDNIIAGTAYLREMLDCYGTAGFLAAYNAGPARYDAHLATGQPLPLETILYVARITPMPAGVQSGNTMIAPALSDWNHAPLFAGHVSGSLAVASLFPDAQSDRGSAAPAASSLAALIPQSNGMFASHFGVASP
ncbi:lytic transglycosylase domain-containing protein [Acidocella sp.]|uniref:lytic transglycosylase domain-containing protein n=1 Tax=Acidocella sp. TaxID=50710 RepID=UPI003D016150